MVRGSPHERSDIGSMRPIRGYRYDHQGCACPDLTIYGNPSTCSGLCLACRDDGSSQSYPFENVGVTCSAGCVHRGCRAGLMLIEFSSVATTVITRIPPRLSTICIAS